MNFGFNFKSNINFALIELKNICKIETVFNFDYKIFIHPFLYKISIKMKKMFYKRFRKPYKQGKS